MKKQEDNIRIRLIWAVRLLLGYMAVALLVVAVGSCFK